MKKELWSTEVAYKNGFNAALDKEALCEAICKGVQCLPAFKCSDATKTYCGIAGDCTLCRVIAQTIRKERGVE